MKGYTDISCHICNFQQPLEHRLDVQGMKGGGGGGGGGVPLQPQGGYPPQGAPPAGGWQGAPPGQQQPMRYG